MCWGRPGRGRSRRRGEWSAYLVDLAITNAVCAGEAGSEGRSEGRRADGAPGGGGHEGRSRASEVLDAATAERKYSSAQSSFQSSRVEPASVVPRATASPQLNRPQSAPGHVQEIQKGLVHTS